MKIEGTRSTPSILIEPGNIEIRGRSIPEDAFAFYKPVQNAIRNYLTNMDQKTELHFYMEYVNSGSKKLITNILANCNESFLKGKNVIIQWHYDYDDESMEELGNDLKSMLQLPFNLIEGN